MNDIPRRNRLVAPAELAILRAIDTVEAMTADVRLTEAVILLGQAKDKVSDYADGIPSGGIVSSGRDSGDSHDPKSLRIQELEADRARLREVLVKYGAHHGGCSFGTPKPPATCPDCGQPVQVNSDLTAVFCTNYGAHGGYVHFSPVRDTNPDCTCGFDAALTSTADQDTP